jgi:hypothetical protein
VRKRFLDCSYEPLHQFSLASIAGQFKVEKVKSKRWQREERERKEKKCIGHTYTIHAQQTAALAAELTIRMQPASQLIERFRFMHLCTVNMHSRDHTINT